MQGKIDRLTKNEKKRCLPSFLGIFGSLQSEKHILEKGLQITLVELDKGNISLEKRKDDLKKKKTEYPQFKENLLILKRPVQHQGA